MDFFPALILVIILLVIIVAFGGSSQPKPRRHIRPLNREEQFDDWYNNYHNR
jgi:hypothetical protein